MSAKGRSAESSPKRATAVKPNATPRRGTLPEQLVLELHAPGMSPLLQAGLGGLAASLYAIHGASRSRDSWPARVSIAAGMAAVEPRRVALHFGGDPAAFMDALIDKSFRIRKQLIHLPGWYRPGKGPSTLLLGLELQRALKRTFLQHGKSTEKDGGEVVKAFEYDDQTRHAQWQAYADFAQRKEGAKLACEALKKGAVSIAGWMTPGAAQRHVGFAQSKWEYGPVEALCALFSAVGCVSLQTAANGGALIVPVPADLVAFGELRHLLTPERVEDVMVSGPSDGVLRIALAARQGKTSVVPAVRSTLGYVLRATPWASQQKSRVDTVNAGTVADATVERYRQVLADLPNKLRVKKQSKQGEEDYFVATSALRGFIADNLAMGRPWHTGFATARAPGKEALFIHYYRAPGNLGALFLDEKAGLCRMVDQLEAAEAVIVRSVHDAMRRRFAVIWADESASKAAKQKRMQSEVEDWRLAFVGAKTEDQIRNALARLWSRAGTVPALCEGWELALPLLRAGKWQTARDLALIGLASYKSERSAEMEAADEVDGETEGETL